MSDTPHLALPLLAVSQAQKHVTVNEALARLDAIVQLAVLDRDLATPPPSPAEGAGYIVAAAPTGAWAGQAGKVAWFTAGAWVFLTPRTGWRAWVTDEAALVHWTGSAWALFSTAITVLQNLALLGIGTTADATNPFSAKLNKALWTAKTAAEGGDGDLRYTLNKETAADVLSFLLQTGFSGRAELGLVGNDDFSLKVSADGSTWIEALRIGRTTGAVLIPAGTAAAPAMQVGQANTGLFRAAADQLATSNAGTEVQRWIAAVDLRGHTAALLGSLLELHATGSTAKVGVNRWSSGNGPAAVQLGRSRSTTIGTFSAVQDADQCGQILFGGDNGSTIATLATILALANGDWSAAGTRHSYIEFRTANAGTVAGRLRIQKDGAITDASNNTIVDGNRHFTLRSYTIATLPAPSPAGQMIHCSDLGGGGGQLNADGTSWRRVSRGGTQTVASDAAFTLTTLTSAEEQRHTGTLTADRTITLSATNAYAGARFRVTRTGGGAFNLSLGGLKSLAQNTWAEAVHDGSAWYLSATGAL